LQQRISEGGCDLIWHPWPATGTAAHAAMAIARPLSLWMRQVWPQARLNGRNGINLI
jgi:hypothetical protein